MKEDKYEMLLDKWGYLVGGAALSIISIKLIVLSVVDRVSVWWIEIIIILITMAAFSCIKKYLKR